MDAIFNEDLTNLSKTLQGLIRGRVNGDPLINSDTPTYRARSVGIKHKRRNLLKI